MIRLKYDILGAVRMCACDISSICCSLFWFSVSLICYGNLRLAFVSDSTVRRCLFHTDVIYFILFFRFAQTSHGGVELCFILYSTRKEKNISFVSVRFMPNYLLLYVRYRIDTTYRFRYCAWTFCFLFSTSSVHCRV